MRVLVACEYSGTVRDAFAACGHDAWSADLLPTDSPGPHIQGDVRAVLDDGWDLMIAHPPCTRLANNGVRWLAERNLWSELDEAAEFFRRILELPIKRIAVENPIPHKFALERIGKRYDQIIQPWQFGHGETKATCLWLKNLPPLKPTKIVEGREARIHKCPDGPDRWKIRSKTYPGIAKAMAAQWGNTKETDMATEKQLNLIRELMEEMDMDEREALNYSPTDTDSIEDLSAGDASVVIDALIDEKDMRKF